MDGLLIQPYSNKSLVLTISISVNYILYIFTRAYVIATQPVLYATFVDMLNQTILNGLGPDHLKAKWEEVHGFEPPQAGHPGPHDDEVGEPAHHP